MANEWARRQVARQNALAKTAAPKIARAPVAPPAAAPPASAPSARVVTDARIMPVGTKPWAGQPPVAARHVPVRRQPSGLIRPSADTCQLVRPDPAFETDFAARMASLPDAHVMEEDEAQAMSDAALREASSLRPNHDVVNGAGKVEGRISGGGVGPMVSGGAGPRAFPAGFGAPAAISGAQPLGSGAIPSVDVSKTE